MEFTKKYPISQRPSEYILAKWSRGYQNIELYFNNDLLISLKGGKRLKKGVKEYIDGFGEIELKLSEDPIALDIIIDGIHCRSNISHPKKQLQKTSFFFWVIAVGALVFGALEVAWTGPNRIGIIVGIINGSVVVLYIVAAIFVSKGKPWAFYLGFSCFSLFTLLYLFTMESGFFETIIIVIRILFLYFLISNLRHAFQTVRHNAYEQTTESTDLIDR
jgi:uncharacterized membrane protein